MRPKIYFLIITILFSGFIIIAGASENFRAKGQSANNLNEVKADISLCERIPLSFIKNEGQVSTEVRYYAKANGYTLWATDNLLTFDQIHRGNDGENRRMVYRMSFPSANVKDVKLKAEDNLKGKLNIFRGGSKGVRHVEASTSEAIKYTSLFTGIDLKVYGKQHEVEYDWVVKAKADPGHIRFRYSGIESSRIDDMGNIRIMTAKGEQVHSRPIAYQMIDGEKISVKAKFKCYGENTYGFRVGAYDSRHDLIIDPVVLVYSSYLGGTHSLEWNYGFYSDGAGKMYITGATVSNDYPGVNAMDLTASGGNYDVFVSVVDTTKIGAASLVYSTLIGGNGVDDGFAITADSDGIIYLTGTTSGGSISDYFPTTDSSKSKGTYDIIFVKIDPTLSGQSQLLTSTIIGGHAMDMGKGIAVKNSNEIFITGSTQSGQYNDHRASFPLTSTAFDNTIGGLYDFFLMKVNGSGQIQYSTYLGGSTNGDESYRDYPKVALTSDGRVYMVSHTLADNFPVKNAFRSSLQGALDGFIALFDTTQSGQNSLVFSTYYGGLTSDKIFNLCVDSNDSLYIVGSTESVPTGTNGFPATTGAYKTYKSGTFDAFVAKLTWNGTTLSNDYCTYMGGSSTETGRSVQVNSSGHILFGGNSRSSNFPLVNSYQSGTTSYDQAFVSLLDITPGGSGLMFSTCLGGNRKDNAKYVNFDLNGTIVVSGATQSTNFPCTSTAYQSARKGSTDTYITVLDPN